MIDPLGPADGDVNGDPGPGHCPEDVCPIDGQRVERVHRVAGEVGSSEVGRRRIGCTETERVERDDAVAVAEERDQAAIEGPRSRSVMDEQDWWTVTIF